MPTRLPARTPGGLRCIEFQDIFVFDGVSALHHEPIVLAGSPERPGHYPERAGRIMLAEAPVRFETFSFGSLRIDGVTYDHDVVIDCREVRKRNKKPSKKFREEFGHTPLSLEEEIPWKCRRLMIGTGSGALPVMEEVKREAKRRKIKLLILPTVEAIEELKQHPRDTNAILHITC